MNLIRILAVVLLFSVPLLTGVSIIEVETGSGATVTGVFWALQLLAVLGLLLMSPTSIFNIRALPYWIPWFGWFGFVWLSLAWCDDIDSRNLQDAAQLSMPLAVGLLASFAIRSREELKWLLISLRLVLLPLLAFGLAYAVYSAGDPWLEQRARATALAAVFVGGVFLAGLPDRILVPLAGWSACLLVTVLTESRMATAALLAIPVLHPGFRSKWWNVLMVGGAMLAGIALFNTRTFQERFFPFTGHGTLQDVMEGSFISQGRFEAWPQIWAEASQRSSFGHGVGTSFNFVPQVWPEMNHVHNDYLRIVFELGFVGLAFYALVVVWQLIVIYRLIRASDCLTRQGFVAAWLGFCGLLITSATDNTIIYNVFYTNPLFLSLGAAYGVMLAGVTVTTPESATAKLERLSGQDADRRPQAIAPRARLPRGANQVGGAHA